MHRKANKKHYQITNAGGISMSEEYEELIFFSSDEVKKLVDESNDGYMFFMENGPFLRKESLMRKLDEKKNDDFPNILKLEEEIKKCIIGQNEQVRKIITAIYRAKYFKRLKSNVLIIGSSGTGKTETIKQIAKKLKIPYTIEDATKYTQEGYVGADVQDMIINLLENADDSLEKAQNGIIVIDEIDKKRANSSFSDGGDVSGVEVLRSLLKVVEGTIVKIPTEFGLTVNFDTKNLTIIFLGAFSGLEDIRRKRISKHSLGFSNDLEIISEKEKNFLKKDLIEYGMPEEFVGRIDTIVEMNKLTKENLVDILKFSRLSVFKNYQYELTKKGIVLEYDDKIFELIAEEALNVDTGARELSNIVNYIFENILYDVLACVNPIKRCKLSLDIVKDNTKYEIL